MDIFISYTRSDRERAEEVAQIFRSNGWSVWMDSVLRTGDYWDDSIEQAMREAKCVVVLWSTESVRSHWVRTEAEQARQRGILIPANRFDGNTIWIFKASDSRSQQVAEWST